MTKTIESLERLAKLRDQGTITAEEFEGQKAEILNSSNKQANASTVNEHNFDKEKFKIKEVSIAAYTKKGRKEKLEKRKTQLEKKDWKFIDYHEDGICSYANFLQPKQKISLVATIIVAIFVIVLFAVLFSNDDDKQKSQAPVLTQEQHLAKQGKEKQSLAQRQKAGTEVVKQMTSIINNAGMGSYISNVSLEYVSSLPQLVLEVRSNWHYQSKQVRKDATTKLWERWVRLCLIKKLGEEADSCRIKLISQSGDAVGGSRVFAGSLIYVND
jgi:hypothetical protein